MKFLIASDIPGSAYFCNLLLNAINEEKPDKVLLLGDILYHGPRNDLPKDYAPKQVIDILNSLSEDILCVRGNCDSEVDQMVLNFPIMADYIVMYLDGKELYITHGHKFNPNNLPSIKKGTYLMNGHTHVSANEEINGIIYLNPGSVSIPKENTGHSYMIYEKGEFTLKNIE